MKILALIAKEFLKWVTLSNVIALPIGYVVMNGLLQNYAYRITIGFDILVISGGSALVIALLTVSFQAMKAVNTNPAEVLKYE